MYLVVADGIRHPLRRVRGAQGGEGVSDEVHCEPCGHELSTISLQAHFHTISTSSVLREALPSYFCIISVQLLPRRALHTSIGQHSCCS